MSDDDLRTPLGASLKKARERAGLTGIQLGEQIRDRLGEDAGWGAATIKGKVSKIEKGQPPSDAEVTAWAQATGAGDRLERQWLTLAAKAREQRHSNYRQRIAGGQREVQREYNDRAADTSTFTFFETAVFPRYVQTPDYTRAVLTEHHAKHGGIDDVDAAVRERQGSTRFLTAPGKHFTFLIDEPVLRRTRFPAPIMRAQLWQLSAASHLDSVTLGIYPSLSRPVHSFTESAFEIFDDTAFIETALADDHEFLADDVEILERLFARYWQDAVTGDDARAMIADAMTHLS